MEKWGQTDFPTWCWSAKAGVVRATFWSSRLIRVLNWILAAILTLSGCVYVENLEAPAEDEGPYYHLYADFGEGWVWVGMFDAVGFCEDAMAGVILRFPSAVLNCDDEEGNTLSEYERAGFNDISGLQHVR